MTLPSFLFRCRAVQLVLILAFCFRNPAAGQTPAPAPSATAAYTINLSPPNQVGQKFGLVTDVSQKIQMQIDAHVFGLSAVNGNVDQENATHFEAEGEVLDVFPNGGIKKVALTVISLQSTKDGLAVDDLPLEGAKIIAEAAEKKQPPVSPAAPKIIHGDKGRQTVVAATPEPASEPKPTITIDGAPAGDAVAELLYSVLMLGDEDHTTQDEYGTAKPIAVGATWPVNSALFFDALKLGPGNASSLKSTMKFDGAGGEGDDRVVSVSGNFSGDGIKPPISSGIPADSFIGSFVSSIGLSVPATRTKGVERQTTAMKMKIQAHVSKLLVLSASINGTMQMKTSSELTYDAARANPAHDLELDPANAAAYFTRGNARQVKGDVAAAAADFQHAVAIDPAFFRGYLGRAWDNIMKGDFDQAFADYGRVLGFDPKYADAYKDRGAARELHGNFPEALADDRKAIELDPRDSVYPRLHVQFLLRRLGLPEEDLSKSDAGGKNAWEKSTIQFVAGASNETALLAAAGKPGDEPVKGQQCEAYYFIGMMRLLKGDLAGARDFFQKSLATDLKDYYEYQFARAELARMDAVVPK